MTFERPAGGWRFDFEGIKTNAAPDELPPNKFPYAQNIRKTKSVQTRPGYVEFFSLSTLEITTTCPLPGAVISVAYSDNLTASGGTAPYTWAIVSGALPNGLSLASNGHISGTPTETGTFNIVIKLVDNAGTTRTKSCSITVSPGLAIDTTCPLPAGTTSVAYDLFLAASGGVAPYVWTLFSGSLPAGLSLSSAGEISGTPTTGGDSTFTLRVTDNVGGHVDKSCSMCVNFVASDNFDRADGPIDVGQPEWVKFPSAGMPVIISDEIKLGVDSGNFPFCWWNDAGANPTGQFSKLTFKHQNGIGFAMSGPAVMMGGSDSSQDMYIANYGVDVGSPGFMLALRRRLNASVTSLSEVIVTPATGDVIEIVATVNVSDVTLTVFRNGVLTITYVDNSVNQIRTGKPGMAQQVGGGVRQFWDDSEIGDNC